MLREIMAIQCPDRALHVLVASSTNSVVVTFMESAANRFLVTDVNSGDYSSLTVTAAHVKSFLHSQMFNCTQ
jgi:hypothetical protein